jgi:hypothetical protein
VKKCIIVGGLGEKDRSDVEVGSLCVNFAK